jgi:hypothetical protein
MTILAGICRNVRSASAVGGAWLTLLGFAWAQKPPEPETNPAGVPSFAMSYGLVILGITLGLAFVLRGSNRRERAKVEE